MQVVFPDRGPYPVCVFTIGRTDGDASLEEIAAFIEQSEEGAVELKSFLGSDADQDGLEDSGEFDRSEVGPSSSSG